MGDVEMVNGEKDISTNSHQNCLILSSKKSSTRCVPQYERNNFIVRFVFTLASYACYLTRGEDYLGFGGGIDYVGSPNSVIVGGSITSVCVCFRYYHGVVQDTSTEEYYVVSFEDGTYCDNLPPTDIVSHDSTRDDIPAGTAVRVKWGEDEDIFQARVTGRRISVTYEIEFEDESWLSVRREDVYKASEELPRKVQQRLVSEEQSWWLLAPTS